MFSVRDPRIEPPQTRALRCWILLSVSASKVHVTGIHFIFILLYENVMAEVSVSVLLPGLMTAPTSSLLRSPRPAVLPSVPEFMTLDRQLLSPKILANVWTVGPTGYFWTSEVFTRWCLVGLRFFVGFTPWPFIFPKIVYKALEPFSLGEGGNDNIPRARCVVCSPVANKKDCIAPWYRKVRGEATR